MPIEDTPKFLNEQDVQPVKWIDEAVFDLHKGNPDHLTYDQLQEKKMLDITRTAVEAASSGYISGQVKNYAFVNTPDVFAPQPLPVEIPDFTQLSEQELSARVEEFRKALLNDEEIKLFISRPVVPEGAVRKDFDLAA